jgi:hypothetical protein
VEDISPVVEAIHHQWDLPSPYKYGTLNNERSKSMQDNELRAKEAPNDENEPIKCTYILTVGLQRELKDVSKELAREGIKISESALLRFALQQGLPLVRERLIYQT